MVILSLSVVISNILYSIEHIHFLDAAHFFIVKTDISRCEDHIVSSRYFINDYKPVFILRAVYNMIPLIYIVQAFSSYRPASLSQWRAHSKAVLFHTLHRGQRKTRLCPLIS